MNLETIDEIPETTIWIEDENDSSGNSSEFHEMGDSDDECVELCTPGQLVAALNDLKHVSGEYLSSFELINSPLIVIARTNSNQIDDRITFPIYGRIVDNISNVLQIKRNDFQVFTLMVAKEPWVSSVTHQVAHAHSNSLRILSLYQRRVELAFMCILKEGHNIQILNSNWDEYLNNFIVPQIKFRMVLDFDIKPHLKSFWILQAPTEVTSFNCPYDLDENTFAILFIQLPSKLEGGQHSVIPMTDVYRFHGFFDFVAESDGKSEFSSFCFVYHRDFKHELKPITQGVGAYLVYNLIVNSSDVANVPKTPNIEDFENELLLRSLMLGWNEQGKLLISLSNKYTKEDLLLKNLKSDDLALAMLLKKTSDFVDEFSNYEIFLGFLNRAFHGEVVDAYTKFNTKCPSNILQTDYNIECLRHIDGKEMVDFKKFTVNFRDEVWPADCFDGIKSYRFSREFFQFEDQVWNANSKGYHVAKYYRVPVLVLFQRYNFIEELKKSLVAVSDIYKLFIILYEEYNGIPMMEQRKFDNWAWITSRMSLPECRENRSFWKELSVRFLKVLINLGDIRSIQNYFQCNHVLTEEIAPLLISQCNKYGWLKFSQEICNMFKQTHSFPKAQKVFRYFLEGGDCTSVPNKRDVLQSVFDIILKNEKTRYHHDYKEFLRSVWSMAKKGGLDIREYGKSQSIDDMVPVLLELSECDPEFKSDDNWFAIAKHFHKILEVCVASQADLSWGRPNVSLSGNCECIHSLIAFLRDDLQSTTLNLNDTHRNHLKSVINRMPYLEYMTSDELGNGDIFILKTKTSGNNNKYTHQRNLHMLTKLCTIFECR